MPQMQSLSALTQDQIVANLSRKEFTDATSMNEAAQVLEHLTCMVPQLDRSRFVQLARKVSGLYYSYALAEGNRTLHENIVKFSAPYHDQNVDDLVASSNLAITLEQVQSITEQVRALKEKTLAFEALKPARDRLKAALEENLLRVNFGPTAVDASRMESSITMRILGTHIPNQGAHWSGETSISPLDHATNLLFGVNASLHGKIRWSQWDALLEENGCQTLLDMIHTILLYSIGKHYGSFEFQFLCAFMLLAGHRSELCERLSTLKDNIVVTVYSVNRVKKMIKVLKNWPDDKHMVNYQVRGGASTLSHSWYFLNDAAEYDDLLQVDSSNPYM